MARQENVWSLFEQVRLGHLMVEAAGRVMEALISEKVDVDAALGFIYLGNLVGVMSRWYMKKKNRGRGNATKQTRWWRPHGGRGGREENNTSGSW